MRLKQKIFFILISFYLLSGTSALGQFVETPEVTNSTNVLATKNNFQAKTISDVLIIISAIVCLISFFGFVVGILKLITSGGDEITAETATNMLVLSGWLFGASIFSYLIINLIKYFIY